MELLGVKRFLAKGYESDTTLSASNCFIVDKPDKTDNSGEGMLTKVFFPFKALLDLFTTELNLCHRSVVMGFKSEGRRPIRVRMGYDTSSKQHNIS